MKKASLPRTAPRERHKATLRTFLGRRSNFTLDSSEAKAGKIEYRLDKQNIIHVPVGKASFGAEKLYTNLDTVMEAIAKAKPAAAKGTYFKSATIATTMGPGIRLNTLKYGV